MAERDPLELLSADIGTPRQPDPEFAARLLDDLLDELTDATSAASGLRVAADVDIPNGEASTDVQMVELLEIVAPAAPEDTTPTWVGWMLRAAAIALLIVGGLAVVAQVADVDAPVATDDSEDSRSELPAVTSTTTTTEVEAPPVPNAVEQIALDFLNARNAYDGEAMRQLLSEDATIFNDFGIATPDDYPIRAEYDRLINTQLTNIECSSFDPDRASCVYTLNTDISRHLRADGYLAELVVTVRDGSIVDLVAGEAGFSFGSDGLLFTDWLRVDYPEEAALLLDPSTQQALVNAESGAVIANRLPEFIATNPPPIETLIARDSRFTTLTEALNRTGVVTAIVECAGLDATLFAPTNDAIDRFIEGSGLERDVVLGDETLFQSLVVDGAISLDDVTASNDQTLELTTLSGDTITVTGGAQPQVQGVPIILDGTDASACNGTFHVIDDVYLSQ